MNADIMNDFVDKYFIKFQNLLTLDSETREKIIQVRDLFQKCSDEGGTIYFLGNGGSASIASHVSVDLSKNAKIRASNFNEANLVTCLANDFGHDNWMKEALKIHADKKDVVVLISSSGKSINVVNAAKWCTDVGMTLITFTGMDKSNPLFAINDGGVNFWVDSRAYNFIETLHQFWLLCVVDLIIGRIEYPASGML